MTAMLHVILLMFFVFSTLRTGFQSVVEIKPPRLISEFSGSKEVNSGKDFELVCECDKPVHWFYPQLTMDTEEDESYGLMSMINITNTITNTGEYRSVLKVTNSYFLDTGYYYCIVNGTTDFHNALENVTRVYVYIKDLINLLVRNESFIIQAVQQHQPAVIPCRPTSLDVNVTLWKDNTQIHLGIHEEGVMNVTYDPTVGFTLDPINIMHIGIYECRGKLWEEHQELHCHLDILKGSSFIPKPSINETYLNPVVVGGKLYLECVARATHGIKFTIQWHLPETVKSERAVYNGSVSYDCGQDATYHCSVYSLTIENVTLHDRGNYTCQVTDHNMVTNKETRFIKIHEAGQSYINLSIDALTVRVKAGTEHVQWVVNVDASPMPSYIWFDKSHEEIKPQNSVKYKIEERKGRTQITLIIKKIQIYDAGTYEFRVYNDKVEKMLNLTLIVTDKPAVSLENSQSYLYQLGMTYKLKCKIVGFPQPEVKWFFSECDLINDCEELTFKEIQVTPNPEISDHTYSDTLEWAVDRPGLIKCFANNSEGNSSETLSLFVTDIPDEKVFSIWGKPEKVVVGDNFTLHCGASKYNFTEPIVWYEERDGYASEQPVRNNSGCSVTRNNTEYSYRVSMTWKDIPAKSDANYICYAARKDDIKDSLMEYIRVYDPVPISIISNMNSSELLMESGSSLELKCIANGLPVPTVKWYKDGILIGSDPRIELRDRNETLYIQFAKLEDEGMYTCVVSNRLEELSKFITLQFKDKPEVNILIHCIIGFAAVVAVLAVCLCFKVYRERKLRKELDIVGLANFEKGALENINPELPVDDQAELLPYDKKWEFPRDKLKLGKQLGAGAFGVVLKAEAWGIIEGEMKTVVAVKMVKRNTDHTYIKALVSELKIMVHLGKHLNVVNLLGASTKNLAKMELLVIVEYCRFGNLHNYLLRHREDFVDQIDPKTGHIDPAIGVDLLSRNESIKSKSNSGDGSHSGESAVDYRAACVCPSVRSLGPTGTDIEMNLISMTPSGEQDEYMLSNNSIQPEWRSNYKGDYKGTTSPVCTRDLLCWAFQVARGMDYLASRKVMHGDLAARNILLADDNVVKICDFGLAKSMYKSDNYRKKGDGPLPVKWMAVESIRDRIFSTQSDVWSYGIVLWEFFSLARTPYPGMEADEKLYNKLVDGYRMEQPQYAPKEIYDIMMKCWQTRPSQRPSFGDLAEELGNMLEESVKRHYIDLNDPYMDMNAQWMQGIQNDYLSMMNSPSYGNMVSPTFDDGDHEYVNSPHTKEATLLGGGECSGYLCMKSPVPESIFSPRRKEDNVFSFSPHLQQQRRQHNSETKNAQGMEGKPMLSTSRNSSESDAELDHLSDLGKGLGFLNQKQEDELNDRGQNDNNISILPSFSNPSYQSVMPITSSADNYVNMPQQKKLKNDMKSNPDESQNENKEVNISDPNCVSTKELEEGLNHRTSPHSEKWENELNCKDPLNGMKYQNSFLNPNYQLEIKTNNVT
ncbi:vascular endothelial growth factor receptor 2-like isoform X4 [Zootermopsis nevadensis]|uniref:vascular endothelial growth factor receptor 2-like isoform X4 n=1 Tax=Zootermopsis nevadensis TaxID=136037 RepID=UPI000B8EE80A|nr:vascular endothelial growth factor receptor 2-like isoform X4 [Zootermopsis nevadensis]